VGQEDGLKPSSPRPFQLSAGVKMRTHFDALL